MIVGGAAMAVKASITRTNEVWYCQKRNWTVTGNVFCRAKTAMRIARMSATNREVIVPYPRELG